MKYEWSYELNIQKIDANRISSIACDFRREETVKKYAKWIQWYVRQCLSSFRIWYPGYLFAAFILLTKLIFENRFYVNVENESFLKFCKYKTVRNFMSQHYLVVLGVIFDMENQKKNDFRALESAGTSEKMWSKFLAPTIVLWHAVTYGT